jgi:hypothetical protein
LTAARKWSWCALALLTLSTACDDDPTEPSVGDLTADVSITPDTLGVQEAIRIVFNRSVDAATADNLPDFSPALAPALSQRLRVFVRSKAGTIAVIVQAHRLGSPKQKHRVA